MKVMLKLLTFLFLVSAVILGTNQLSYKSSVMADPQLWCCNVGDCNGQPCSHYVQAVLVDDCYEEIGMSCYQCINYHYYGQLCEPDMATYCVKADGSRYYGGPDPSK